MFAKFGAYLTVGSTESGGIIVILTITIGVRLNSRPPNRRNMGEVMMKIKECFLDMQIIRDG